MIVNIQHAAYLHRCVLTRARTANCFSDGQYAVVRVLDSTVAENNLNMSSYCTESECYDLCSVRQQSAK